MYYLTFSPILAIIIYLFFINIIFESNPLHFFIYFYLHLKNVH